MLQVILDYSGSSDNVTIYVKYGSGDGKCTMYVTIGGEA